MSVMELIGDEYCGEESKAKVIVKDLFYYDSGKEGKGSEGL